MKRSKFIVIVMALATGIIFHGCDTAHTISDPGKNYFLKYYGDDGNQTAVDLAVNTDGTFILFGTTQKPDEPHSQLFLVKTDANGNVLWQKTFGGSLNDEARDVEVASDGRIVVAGNTYVTETSRDIYVKTFTPDGVPIDSVQYGLTIRYTVAPADDDVSSITIISDGYIVTGSTDNVDTQPTQDLRDAFHVRFYEDFTTNPAWRQTHSGGVYNFGTKVFELDNQGFCFFGYQSFQRTDDPGVNFSFWVLPLSVTGEGSAPLRPGSISDERLGSVTQIRDPSGFVFFMGGVTTNGDNTSSLYVARINAKISSSGVDFEQGFQNSAGTQLSTPGEFHASVAASSSGGFYILSNENTTNNSNLFLTKLTDQGLADSGPNAIYGGAGQDFAGSVLELPDGKLIISGTMAVGSDGETKMVLIKVNRNGQFAD